MARRIFMLVYAAGAYAASLLSIVYILGFLIDFGVPKGISDGAQTSVWFAVLIDAGLMGLFGLHHSVTARASFKQWWTRIIPPSIERATYLYMTVVLMALLVMFWCPIPVTVWQVEAPWATGAIYAVYLGVWTMMFAATFHFGHFGFFGLAQAWQNFRNMPPKSSALSVRYLYALVRHPISLGWMITPLAVPHLTVGHLVFAGATFVYVMIATPFEETDLIAALGNPYRDYRRRVPRFVPLPRKIRALSKKEQGI